MQEEGKRARVRQEFEDATLVLLKRGRDHKSRNAGSLKDRTNTQSVIY